jgi:hypothetical protein
MFITSLILCWGYYFIVTLHAYMLWALDELLITLLLSYQAEELITSNGINHRPLKITKKK